MRRFAMWIFLFAASSVALALPGKLVLVRLSDGSQIAGHVVQGECNEQVLVLRELRSGAKRTVQWSDIDAKQRHELRIALGFEVAAQQSLPKVEAVQIVNRANMTFIGKLVNPDSAKSDGEYRLKTSEGERRIPVADVRDGPTKVMVDALRIFTPPELVQQKVAEHAPQTAEDYFKLAEFARIVGDLDSAKKYYEAVLNFSDSRYNPDTIHRLLDRVNKLLGSREAEDALRAIKRAYIYNRFDDAAKLLDDFRKKYTDADLLKEATEVEKEGQQHRTDYYTQQVTHLFLESVKEFLGKKVREDGITLKDGEQYAGSDPSSDKSVTHDALAAVGQKLGIKPDEVLEFWKERPKRAIQHAFYRDGTFIIVENLQDALSKAPKFNPQAGGGNKRNTGRNSGPIKLPKPTPRMTPDNWWKQKVESHHLRDLRDWLYAYWAEHSGLTQLLDPKKAICQVCAGKGYVQTLITTPQGMIPFFDRCQNCHMAGYWKIVLFK